MFWLKMQGSLEGFKQLFQKPIAFVKPGLWRAAIYYTEFPSPGLSSPPYANRKEIVVSGIRPTGYLHLGNYFGAVRNYVRMQEEYDCYFFVADWHSLTTHPDTKELQATVCCVYWRRILLQDLIPIKRCCMCKEPYPEIAELYLYLNMMAYKGELEKTALLKTKCASSPIM